MRIDKLVYDRHIMVTLSCWKGSSQGEERCSSQATKPIFAVFSAQWWSRAALVPRFTASFTFIKRFRQLIEHQGRAAFVWSLGHWWRECPVRLAWTFSLENTAHEAGAMQQVQVFQPPVERHALFLDNQASSVSHLLSSGPRSTSTS